MRVNTWRTPVLCLTAVLSLIALAGPAVADDEIEDGKNVKIKVIECEDGDCQEMIENLVGGEKMKFFLGDDVAKKIVIRKFHCEGEDCEEHAGDYKMVFVRKVGDVQVIAGDGGHAWFGHGGFGSGGGYLGVGLTELTPELREHFGVPAGTGVMVSKVMDASPALEAGLEVGDIIAGVDGETIDGGWALGKNIRGHAAGEEVVLDVWRDGTARSITATLEESEGGGLHALHMGDMHHRGDRRMHKIIIRCDSDDEDCESSFDFDLDFDFDIAGLDDFDCGGSDECDVRVECEDGGCTCTINGEDADCAGIPGVPGL